MEPAGSGKGIGKDALGRADHCRSFVGTSFLSEPRSPSRLGPPTMDVSRRWARQTVHGAPVRTRYADPLAASRSPRTARRSRALGESQALGHGQPSGEGVMSMSSRNVDRFPERRKLMILAVVVRVCDVRVVMVESECPNNREFWVERKRSRPDSILPGHHLSHGNPNETIWPARSGVVSHSSEDDSRLC